MTISKELDLKTTLYDLLMLKQDGIKSIRLEEMIARTKSAMTDEDVIYVEKQITELITNNPR